MHVKSYISCLTEWQAVTESAEPFATLLQCHHVFVLYLYENHIEREN